MMTVTLSSGRPAVSPVLRLPDEKCGLHEFGFLCTNLAESTGAKRPGMRLALQHFPSNLRSFNIHRSPVNRRLSKKIDFLNSSFFLCSVRADYPSSKNSASLAVDAFFKKDCPSLCPFGRTHNKSHNNVCSKSA